MTFTDFVCIDWSGQSVERPKGLAVAHARIGSEPPVLLTPQKGWSRQAILDWLKQHAVAGTRMLVGLDLSPALPFVDCGAYFPGWCSSPPDARALWRLIDEISIGDPHLSASSFVHHSEAARYFRRQGLPLGDRFGTEKRGRFRVVEHHQRQQALSPYSCFNLIGAAQVGKSSLTGMRVLHRLAGKVPIWPFDAVPDTGPLIVEIYTSIAARAAGIRAGLSKIRDGAALDSALAALGTKPHRPLPRYDDHSTDAILTAAWLRHVAEDHALWKPPALTPGLAQTEGWTFGVR
jgi:hypothetical protein